MDSLNERVLDDDYPVHFGYCYVADGKVTVSQVQGTVATLKRHLKCLEVRNCDIFGRNKLNELKKSEP